MIKPKKSKAFIITFVSVVLLLIVGYFLFAHRNNLLPSKTLNLGKIFEPLLGTHGKNSTKGQNGVTPGNGIILARAGENINKGDSVYQSGTSADGKPIVMKYTPDLAAQGINPIGTAEENIKSGDIGNILSNVPIVMKYTPDLAAQGINPIGTAEENMKSGDIGNILSNIPGSTANISAQAGENINKGDSVYQKRTNTNGQPGSTVNISAQAGENINAGDFVYQSGTNANGQPIIMKYTPDLADLGISPIGISIDDINLGDIGNIKINPNIPTPNGGNGTTNNASFTFPTVSVTANPSSVSSGGSSTITWSSKNATSCKIPTTDKADTSGTFDTGVLTKTTSYSITCTGESGTGTGIAIVTVIGENNLGKIPTVSVSSSPTVIHSGGSSTISWTSENAKSCTLSGGGLTGSGLTNKGVSTGALTKSTSYSVSCKGDNGTTARTAVVIVLNIYGPKYVCSDEIDNDGDKLIDIADPQCHSDGNASNPNSYVPTHYSESVGPHSNGTFQCNDKIDNDRDGLIDAADPQCHTDGNTGNTNSYVPTHNSESVGPGGNKTPQCSNKIDDDGDGLIDAADPQCHTDGNADNPKSYDHTITSEQGSIGIPCEVTNSCPPNPNPTVKTECSDEIDNDGDGLIDKADPSCHTDFNANNSSSYDTNLNDEAANPSAPNPNVTPNKCQVLDQYPLTFTPEQKTELAVLLRKFYLIAPTLKTEDDNVMVYDEINKYKTFIKQITDLTQTCYEETDNKTGYEAFCSEAANKDLCYKNKDGSWDTSNLNGAYTGPKTIYGNPWFNYSDRGSYLDDPKDEETKKLDTDTKQMLHEYEILLNIW